MDALKNFAYSNVAVAPVPATSGTALTVTTGQGAYFPTAPFDATIWPSGVQPINTNAEIVRVTNVVSDVLTITRAQYGTTAQTITAGYQIAQTVDANLLNQLAPLSGATFTGEVVAPDFKASGLTGATAASRYVGATTNGAPVSGTFAVGDFIIDQTSTIWVCLVAGTPGTWWPLIEAHMVSRSATATATANEVTIFTGSTASQTISVIALPIDGATWTIINRSSVPVTAGFGASSMLPLGSTSSVTSLVVPVNGAYSFINYAAGQWYMTASNNLANSVGSTALATVNITAQSAAQAATTLYTPASDGLFTIDYYAKVTTAATTSSTLGVFSIISTDTDSNVITSVGQSTQQNSLTTGFISGSITVYAKAATPIQYSLAYASSGATAMQYELRVVVAGTTAPSSTGTVSSFNGRTGAVTPATGDYLAVPTGGLTGATAATRYVGGTTSGAPTTGTFAVGDYIVDQTGKIYVCTTAGTPGTWTQVGSTNATQLQGTNISVTAPTSNQVLQYNSGTSSWTPTTFSGGAPGTIVSSFLTAIKFSTGSNQNITSISLTAGTWIVTIQTYIPGNSTVWDFWIGPNSASITGSYGGSSCGPGTTASPAFSYSYPITLASTTTVYFNGIAPGTSGIGLAYQSNNGSASNATGMFAVKMA